MNNVFNILVFSKDNNLGLTIKDYFNALGHNVEIFDNEAIACKNVLSQNFNVCIIDYEPNNLEIQHLAIKIKSSEKEMPVIFLCDHPTREDISYIFSLHADDLIRKPLDLDIVYAHIKSILNRYQPTKEINVKTYLFGKFRFEVQKQMLTIEDKSIKLTTKEGELLALFCKNANELIDRNHTLHLIWKNDTYFSARSMDVYITKLRKHLKDDPSIRIINVHGKGYKFITQPEKDEH